MQNILEYLILKNANKTINLSENLCLDKELFIILSLYK
jgi:hypothetical protein